MEGFQHNTVGAGPAARTRTPTFHRINYNPQLPYQPAQYWRFPLHGLNPIVKTASNDSSNQFFHDSQPTEQETLSYQDLEETFAPLTARSFDPEGPSFGPDDSFFAQMVSMSDSMG